MDRFDDRLDDELTGMFESFRQEAQGLVAAPGAGAAREAARRRRQTTLVAGVAVLVSVLSGGVGYLAGIRTQPQSPAAGVTSTVVTVTPSTSVSPGSSRTASGDLPEATGPPQGPAGGTAEVPLPRCHTNDLIGHLVDPTPGQTGALLVLTNVSGHRCQMYGYPGMRLIDAAGDGLPTTVLRDGTQRPVLFVVEPGGGAWAKLTWSATVPSASPSAEPSATLSPRPGGVGAPCEPPAEGLLVTPPDETTQLPIRVQLRVCPDGRITTGPVQAQPPS